VVAFSHDEERVRAERARAVALFRYSLIREPADSRLSTRARGRLVRSIAAREHEGPSGRVDALVPTPPRVSSRTPVDVLELAVALKREVPERTAVQMAAILRANGGWSPEEGTLQRHFVRPELNTRPNGLAPRAFGRFEADTANHRWTGDALHGPTVGARKAILFAFIDDNSRLLAGIGGWAEDTVRLGSRAPQRPGQPRHPGLDLSRQRLGDDPQAAATGMRRAWHPPGPLPPRATGRPGEDRKVLVRHEAPCRPP